MADETYQPLVYMMQDGNELVVASGGLATIESGGEVTIERGGTIDVESGGGLDVQSGGNITVENGGKLAFVVNGATSSGLNGSSELSTQSAADGVTFICSSGGTQGATYKITLAPPYPGAQKLIYHTAGSTGMHLYVSAGTDIGIITTGGDSTSHLMICEATTSGGLAGYCHLTGLSTSRWIRTSFAPTSQWIIASTSS